MAYTYTDITAAGVKIICKDQQVTFDGPGLFVRYDLPTNGMFVRGLDMPGCVVAIAKGQDEPKKDRALLCNSLGVVEDIGPNHGNQSVGLTRSGDMVRAVYVKDGSTLAVSLRNPYTLVSDVEGSTQTVEPWAQGFLDLEPTKPTHKFSPIVLGGVSFFYPFSRGDWTVGNHADNRVLVYRHSTAQVFVAWAGDTQVPARINANGVVAVSGEDGGNPQSLFVTPDQFVPYVPPQDVLPPVDDVPLMNRPFGVICYTFNDAPCLGNINLPIRPTAKKWTEPIVLPSDRPDLAAGNQVWAVYAGEGPGLSAEQAAIEAGELGGDLSRGLNIYQDSFPTRNSVGSMSLDVDILSCICKRRPDEALDAFLSRVSTEVSRWDRLTPFYPTLNLTGDTAKRAVDTFIGFVSAAKAHGWRGMGLFAVGRSDVPWEALQPYLKRFMSGVTGTPAARVIPDPLPDPPDDEDLPGDPTVIYLITDKSNNICRTEPLGEKKLVDNGAFAIVKPNGKLRTLNPAGQWEERDNVPENIRTWERYYDGHPAGTLAPGRDDKTFWLETVEK